MKEHKGEKRRCIQCVAQEAKKIEKAVHIIIKDEIIFPLCDLHYKEYLEQEDFILETNNDFYGNTSSEN